MSNQTAVRFYNFSDEDFSHTWDSVIYTFKAGETIMLESYLAEHFAKHLVDRELNKEDLITNLPHNRIKFYNQCIIQSDHIEARNEVDLKMKMMNKNEKSEEIEAEIEKVEEPEEPVKKERTPEQIQAAKDKMAKARAARGKKKEENFEGLEDVEA